MLLRTASSSAHQQVLSLEASACRRLRRLRRARYGDRPLNCTRDLGSQPRTIPQTHIARMHASSQRFHTSATRCATCVEAAAAAAVAAARYEKGWRERRSVCAAREADVGERERLRIISDRQGGSLARHRRRRGGATNGRSDAMDRRRESEGVRECARARRVRRGWRVALTATG